MDVAAQTLAQRRLGREIKPGKLANQNIRKARKVLLLFVPFVSYRNANEYYSEVNSSIIRGEIKIATVNVRYIVNDVDAAIAFYCKHLDFHEVMHSAPTFAMLTRGNLRLLLSAPSAQGGGGQNMPDGTKPEPGGWNRISLEVSDLESLVEKLRQNGIHFRNDIVVGVGGNQILLEDPSGNPVELFESTH